MFHQHQVLYLVVTRQSRNLSFTRCNIFFFDLIHFRSLNEELRFWFDTSRYFIVLVFSGIFSRSGCKEGLVFFKMSSVSFNSCLFTCTVFFSLSSYYNFVKLLHTKNFNLLFGMYCPISLTTGKLY